MPIAPTNGGRIIGTRTTAEKTPLPAKSNLCEIHASGSATSRQSVVVPSAIRTLLPSPSA